jgi:hypothetical protein
MERELIEAGWVRVERFDTHPYHDSSVARRAAVGEEVIAVGDDGPLRSRVEQHVLRARTRFPRSIRAALRISFSVRNRARNQR